MALKIDPKFEVKLTCAFKIDMRNSANVHRLTNSDFILRSKKIKIKIQNTQIKQMQRENFILPQK